MFKGLRTKIESEQKDQGNINNSRPQPKASINNNTASQGSKSHHPSYGPESPSGLLPDQTSISRVLPEPGGEDGTRQTTNTTEAQSTLDHQAITNQQSYHRQLHGEGNKSSQTVDQLRAEVSRLQEQLKSVMKERDDSNDQNGQLYQLIEKLRRNLESEKELNFNLVARLEEAEKRIAETSQTKNETTKRGAKQASTSKSFNPSMMIDSMELQSDDIENLRKHVMDLQGQITDKNRQLKIRQQNLNDIKRHLQMELAEHAKTQEELKQVQDELKQANQICSARSDSVTPQNGSSACDIESTKSGSTSNNASATADSRQTLFHETTRAPESIARLQYDNISCISRSSNSVDDNDLHDHLHHSSNREINSEYLKNVLFRYMTSADTETAKHLVKALSVMMNFTPEQTAAVKSAMDARASWLRLK